MATNEERIVYLIENGKTYKNKDGMDATYGVIKRYDSDKYSKYRNEKDYIKVQNRIKDVKSIYG